MFIQEQINIWQGQKDRYERSLKEEERLHRKRMADIEKMIARCNRELEKLKCNVN